MGDLFAIPEVVANIPSQCGPVLRNVPSTARQNVYLHPWHLSLSENAKAGRYPSMHQTRIHFPTIVWKNYLASREALEIKFDAAGGEAIDFFFCALHRWSQQGDHCANLVGFGDLCSCLNCKLTRLVSFPRLNLKAL